MATVTKSSQPTDLGGGGDGNMQKMLRALKPQEIILAPLTPEEAADAEKRQVTDLLTGF